MLPNIDPTSSTNVSAPTATSPAKRPESEQLVREAYQTMQNVKESSSTDITRKADSASGVKEARTAAADKAQSTGAAKPGTRTYDRAVGKDQAEINFQMTREERDVFLNYTSGREEPGEMTEEEQSTLQKVSERLEKLIEEAEARDTEKAERLERAIKEWYNRLSNGKDKAPANLYRLITQAAMGVADLSKVDV